jgi:hypothetical protein
MDIPEQYIDTIVQYSKTRYTFIVGRFAYEDVWFEVRLMCIRTPINMNLSIPETFLLKVSFERYPQRVVQFTTHPTDESSRAGHIRDLLERFMKWKKFIFEKKVHFLNDSLEPLKVYQAKLYLAEWTNGESNDVCYVCHEPCLYYENWNCTHRIHRLCLVKMIQNNQRRCGLCKKVFFTDDEEEIEYQP